MRTSNVNQPATNTFSRKARITGAVMLSAFCLVGMTSCEDDEDDPILNTYNQQDRNFAMSSSQYLNAQIDFGQLALDNGEDDSVLEYGTMLTTENTESKTELEGLLADTDVEISSEISSAMQAKFDELEMLSGEEFDEAFIDFQLELLNDSMSMFENQNDNGENNSLKDFADKTLGKTKDQREDAVLVKTEIDIENI
jgi:predicted outer membrane protein